MVHSRCGESTLHHPCQSFTRVVHGGFSIQNKFMWVALTEQNVLAKMSQKEIDALNALYPGSLVTTRLQEILNQVTKRIRLAVGSCKQNNLTVDATLIPDEFISEAVNIVRWEFCSVLPNYDLGGTRKKAYDDAIAILRDVAKCVFRPEPATQATLSGSAAVPDMEAQHGAVVVCSQPQRTGRQNMNGL